MSQEITEDNLENLDNLKSEISILTRSDGSAIFYQGDTITLASIYGPMEAKQQHMLIEKAFVQAHYRPKSGLPGVSDRLRESFIRNTCETALMATLYPRTTVQIIIQEVQNCGGLLSCALNAACLAMLDSGVEMKYLFGAVSCMLDADNNIIVEPEFLKLENAVATFTFVFDSCKGEIIASQTTGTFTKEQFCKAVSLSRTASARVFTHYKNNIKRKSVEC